MKNFGSILVVVERSARDTYVLDKAVALAECFNARIELFLCDAEHEYALRHSYDAYATAKGRDACLADAGHYLETLRRKMPVHSIEVTLDAACETPLYEGIVKRALKSSPDLVMKSVGEQHHRQALNDNDWQLMRACPTPLMLVGPRAWSKPPRFAVAVDVSSQETPGFARAILDMSQCMRAACAARVDVISCERGGMGDSERQEHARSVRSLASEIRVPDEHVHILDGHPEQVLPAFAADQHYDVLIMGALTHRPALVPLVGTLTSRLVDALDCDFVLVRPERATGTTIPEWKMAAR
jgi:universal stress protein E